MAAPRQTRPAAKSNRALCTGYAPHLRLVEQMLRTQTVSAVVVASVGVSCPCWRLMACRVRRPMSG